MARFFFFVSLFFVLVGGALTLGIWSGAKRNALYKAFDWTHEQFELFFVEASNIGPRATPIHFINERRHGGSGVTVNNVQDDALVMITGFFGDLPGIRLIERDGTIVQSWAAPVRDHFSGQFDALETEPVSNWHVDIHGAAMLPDGSVVFNYEYTAGIKLGPCGQVIWRTTEPVHHSVEPASSGGFWIPSFDRLSGSEALARFDHWADPNAAQTLQDDTIARFSAEGTLLDEVSLLEVLLDNGFEALLSANGLLYRNEYPRPDDILHINKIAELSPDLAPAFPMFEAGDLLLSLRHYNMILVVDPDGWKVKWHKIGPWLRQHDPEFTPNGEIWVFDNGLFANAFLSKTDSLPKMGDRTSRIIAVDPATNDVRTVTETIDGRPFRSIVRGKHDPQPGGTNLITEFEAGRLVEVDQDGTIVWEYINAQDDTHVIELTEGRIYQRAFFEGQPWSCPSD